MGILTVYRSINGFYKFPRGSFLPILTNVDYEYLTLASRIAIASIRNYYIILLYESFEIERENPPSNSTGFPPFQLQFKMVHALARPLLLMLLVGSALLSVESKTLNRRTDKISENFKQLDLPPEEIDPNVAPPEPQKLETAVAEAAAETVAEPAAATTAAAATGAADAAEAVDEAANEIASADAAAAAPVTEAAVAKPKPKPTKPTKQDDNPISRFCKCTESHCDCCRKFGLPLLPSGPGCAKIAYLGNDEMSVSLKFGDITLASRRISSKRARPICVSMPGGYSKFCGRVYGLSRAQENFKACLAFELRSDDELEAQLPISCFKFGSEGLRVAEAEPLPTKVKKPEEDDDDDIFGFGGE